MSPSPILSPNAHVRQSHYLQRPHDLHDTNVSHAPCVSYATHTTLAPPPSAFTRTTGFRSTLKKIPSALFSKVESPRRKAVRQVKVEKWEQHPIRADTPDRPMTSDHTVKLPSPQLPSSIPTGTQAKPSARIKTRRVLAGILSWGNSAKTAVPVAKPAPPVQLSPLPLSAPPVPAKDANMVLRKLPPRAPSTKSSISGLSGHPLLGAPLESRRSASRPSMGADPFGRAGEGAEIVEHIARPGGTTPPTKSKIADERCSIGSAGALLGKSDFSDVSSAGQTTHRSMASTRTTITAVFPRQQEAINQVNEVRQHREPTSPLPFEGSVADLPPRSSSLAKSRDFTRVDLSPQPSALAVAPQLAPARTVVSGKIPIPMKKERTRSNVWGILGRGKSKNHKTSSEQPPRPVVRLPANDGIVKSAVAPSVATDHVASIPPAFSARRIARHGPPILHLSQPSDDIPPFQRSNRDSCADRMSIQGNCLDLDGDPSASPQSSLPNNACSMGRGGVWESVAGSSAERPSEDGVRHTIEALIAVKTAVPKRKSLTGLFGSAVKRSMDRLRAASPPKKTRLTKQPSFERCSQPTMPLRTLAEKLDHTIRSSPVNPSAPYHSRFGNGQLKMESAIVRADRKPQSLQNEIKADQPAASLRRVASATDKLTNLVSHYDMSPGSTPSNMSSRSPILAIKASMQSLRHPIRGSPTPIRRVQSAMLYTMPSGSPTKSSLDISPLKLALHRAQMKVQQTPVQTGSAHTLPVGNSLVRKGMRNVFAPPTPEMPYSVTCSPDEYERIVDLAVSPTLERGAYARTTAYDLKTRQDTTGPEVVIQRASRTKIKMDTGIPIELEGIFGLIDRDVPDRPALDPESTSRLGLPPLPPADRVSHRRPARQPPAISLPPVPDDVAEASSPPARVSMLPPHISLEVARDQSARSSMFSDIMSIAGDFDFTGEYAALDQGDHRASFIEAVRRAGPSGAEYGILSGPQLPALPELPVYFAMLSPVREDASVGELSFGLPLAPEVSGQTDAGSIYRSAKSSNESRRTAKSSSDSRRTPRPEPFKGQFAFQQHVLQIRNATPPPTESPGLELEGVSYQDELLLPPCSHQRDESGLSIATMSSIGAVIETGVAGEYTNYFEVNFVDHMRQQSLDRASHLQDSVDEVSQLGEADVEAWDVLSANRDSIISATSINRDRAPTRRSHHRRNTSIQSADSLGLADVFAAANDLPPVTMFNRRRSGYVSRHRRGDSSDASLGRADWAAHRRGSSSADSADSSISVARISRPGLGARMFQLDGGVQLTSITGSPSYEPPHEPQFNSIDPTLEALLRETKRASTPSSSGNSAYYTGIESESSCDFSDGSFFSRLRASPSGGSQPADFVLHGTRPLSVLSTSSSTEHRDDTFINVAKYTRQHASDVEPKEACFEAEGESRSTFTPTKSSAAQANLHRHVLAGSLQRPAKPRSAQRRRPAQLVFADAADLDTPGLTSPSASETSSRMSLETRLSEGGSLFSSSRIRTQVSGHRRQRSSAGVKLHATIREEPSIATLRGVDATQEQKVAHKIPSKATMREPGVVDWEEDSVSSQAIRAWIDWQREAEEECRHIQSRYAEEEASKQALETFRMPTTNREVADFLAQSCHTYKPLEQLPTSQRPAQRRNSSLSNTRAHRSPYGLPIPKAVQPNRPKTSLITKFERTNSATSATSSNFSFEIEGLIPSAPPSALFAQFTRELPPSNPLNTAIFSPLIPLPLPPALNAFELQHRTEGAHSVTQDKGRRVRVSSSVRREALGWGKRRYSDGPAKAEVQPLASKANKSQVFDGRAKALKPKSSAIGQADKENIQPSSRPPVKPSHPAHRQTRKIASQSSGPSRALRV